MSLASSFSPAILQTILTRLAALFLIGAGGDMTAARHAAAQMLAAYRAETEDELRLAANIVCFSFHALEALSQAAEPGLPLSRVLRLRGSAVSLSRQSHNAERRLDQLQKARRKGMFAQPTASDVQTLETEPRIEKALDLIQDTRKVTVAANAGGLSWTQAYQQRRREARIGAGLKRTEARSAAQAGIAASGIIASHDHPSAGRVG